MTCSPPARRTGPSIADLVHRVTLDAPSRTPDASGGATVVFTVVAEVAAALHAIVGTERLDADRLAGRLTHTVTIRYRSDVTPANRFTLGPRRFEIRSVLDSDNRRRFLTCHCEEIVT